ncbi:hypothetical protein LINPERHAP1_LOCUS297 [Linum perenne]
MLDEKQLRWLKDVLLVSSNNSWKLTAGCVVVSRRRSVIVSDFWRKGIRVLNVLERCRDGKDFFVGIPMDWNSVGWRSLLELLRRLLATHSSPALNPVVVKSFAEVTAQPSLSRSGACSTVIGSRFAFEVLDTGVDDRVSFLNKGLVFRLESLSNSALDWKGFRIWASRSWGVPEGASILALGDELWMLVCSGQDEVERIMNLDRWGFPNHRIVADKWLAEAGISEVCRRRGVVWVLVRGIPIHLRSEAVLREIANCFGPSAVCDAFGCNLNEIRIRTKGVVDFPKGLEIKFREVSFWLPVIILDEQVENLVREVAVAEAGGSRNRFLTSVGRGKKKLMWKPRSAVRACRKGKFRHSVAPAESLGHASLVADKVRWGALKENVINNKEMSEGELPFQSSSELVLRNTSDGCKGVDCGPLLSRYWACQFPGVVARREEEAILGSGGDKALSLVIHEDLGCNDNFVLEEIGHWSMPSKGLENEKVEVSTIEELISTKKAIDAPLGYVSVRDGGQEVSAENGGEDQITAPDLPKPQEPGTVEDSGATAVKLRCMEAIELLEIRSGETAEATTDLVLNTAAGALSRRRKTKLEREQQRIGWSDLTADLEGSRRRPGYVSSPPSYE